ncbi:MAG: response regulator [Acidobacteria bacterium]|nr:response regulator [Acidobacteriota bacterium]
MSVPKAGRILIVDVEASLRRALCETLSDHGYETAGVATGKEALAALRKSEFDLLPADLMMPEMDGIAVLRAAIDVDPDLVGIIMTGQGTIDAAVEAMKTGALDFILKPFILSAIQPVLSRALAVRRLRKEKAELEHRLQQRTVELEDSNKALEAFSYSVSHDLRAPLRAVSGFSTILLKEYSNQIPEDAQGLLRRVTTSARQMDQLIDDLLRLSRLGRQPLSRESVSLTGLVEEVLQELRKAERDRAIEMQYAQRLFGVFQRLHRAEDFEGTGVGLSIVHRIIQRHGGRIWAEAKVDQGATFYFTLAESPPS